MIWPGLDMLEIKSASISGDLDWVALAVVLACSVSGVSLGGSTSIELSLRASLVLSSEDEDGETVAPAVCGIL